MNSPIPNWEALASLGHPTAAIAFLRKKFEPFGAFSIKGEEVSSGALCTLVEAQAILKDLVKHGFLGAVEKIRCAYCHEELQEEEASESECIHCHAQLGTGNKGVEKFEVYVRNAEPTRDVKWVVTVHGMNTNGAWQEEYVWRLAKLYGYSIPNVLYKYGNIKVSPFIPRRRAYFVRRLAENLKRFSADANESGYGGRPDVIAHSLGTWLLYKALESDKDIKIGRLILTGSIIPPNFDWKPLIETKRVEAVLCHHAGKDVVVRMAQYGISNSGPSGHRGFNDKETVIHKYQPLFRHSDFFLPEILGDEMEGIWGQFLTYPISALLTLKDDTTSIFPRAQWHPSRLRFITFPLKNMVLVLMLLFVVFFLLSGVRGLAGTWKWLWDYFKHIQITC